MTLTHWIKTRLFPRPPAPTFDNVEADGPGYYKYSWRDRKWHRVDFRGRVLSLSKGYDEKSRWLSQNRLSELKLDWIIAQRWKKKRRVKIL